MLIEDDAQISQKNTTEDIGPQGKHMVLLLDGNTEHVVHV